MNETKGTIVLTCDYCVFDGENIAEFLTFLNTNTAQVIVYGDNEKGLDVFGNRIDKGDVVVVVPAFGSYRSSHRFLNSKQFAEFASKGER